MTLLAFSSANAASLAWDWTQGEGGTADGFKIYYGSSPGQYQLNVDAGNVFQWHIPDEWPAGVYYFAATAYDATGESGYSNEVQWIKAATPSIQPASGGSYQLTWIEDQPMAISLCSPAYQIVNNSDGSYSGSVTVPADCDFAVMIFLGYSDATRSVSSCTLGGVAMSARLSAGTANTTARWVYALPDPATGSQTFVINHNGSFLAGGSAALIWLKGVHQTTYERDVDSSYGSSSATTQQLTLTSVSGDLGIIFGGGDSGTAYNVDLDSQTKLEEPAAYNSGLVGLAYKSATGTTLTMSGYGAYNGVAGIVLIPASDSASVVPVMMRQYRARR